MNRIGLKNQIKSVVRNAKNAAARGCMRAWALVRPIEKKIVFMSFLGRQYSDNPRAISEKMHALYPEFRLVWVLNGSIDWKDRVPDYVTVVRPGLQRYLEIATAFCYVTNTNNDPDLIKRRGQFFVQTWHGDGGFKKILYANERGRTRFVPVTDNRITDVCMAGSDYGEKKYRVAFQYNGDILKVGCARNDRLIHPDGAQIKAIRDSLKLAPEQKVLLYAPTFRNKDQNNQAINVDLAGVIRHLEARDGCAWVCLVRAHPSARFAVDCSGDGTVDVTDYPDMADLLLVADFLITDYSSCASDFALTRRPIVLATFDRDSYSQEERSLNVTLEETGFIYADSQARLIEIIDSCSDTAYRESCERVLRFYGSAETGHAAERICSMIEEKYRQLSAC